MPDSSPVIHFPPNTKDAQAVYKKRELIVACPHCKKKHTYLTLVQFHAWIPAPCGLGNLVIHVQK